MDKLENLITKLIKKKLKAKSKKSKSKKSKVKKTKDISPDKFDKDAIVKAIISATSGSKPFTPIDTSVKPAQAPQPAPVQPTLISAGLSIPEAQKNSETKMLKEQLDQLRKANKETQDRFKKELKAQSELNRLLDIDFKEMKVKEAVKERQLKEEIENIKREEGEKKELATQLRKRQSLHGNKYSIVSGDSGEDGGNNEYSNDLASFLSDDNSLRENILEEQERLKQEQEQAEELRRTQKLAQPGLNQHQSINSEHQSDQLLKGNEQQTIGSDSDRQSQNQLNTPRISSKPLTFAQMMQGKSNKATFGVPSSTSSDEVSVVESLSGRRPSTTSSKTSKKSKKEKEKIEDYTKLVEEAIEEAITSESSPKGSKKRGRKPKK
jgi:hypothetical protein